MNTRAEKIVDVVRQNPEGLLLLGAGLVLLLRNLPQSGGTRAKRQATHRKGRSVEATRTMTEGAGEYIKDTANSLKETASVVTEKATAKAAAARQSAGDLVESHPLIVASAGVAAGMIAAALFPSTEVEERSLGPIGQKAREVISELGSQAKDAAIQAGIELKDGVIENGLSKTGVAEAIKESVAAFADNMQAPQTDLGGANDK